MSEKGKRIMEALGKAVPQRSELDKEKRLAFGKGVALMAGAAGKILPKTG